MTIFVDIEGASIPSTAPPVVATALAGCSVVLLFTSGNEFCVHGLPGDGSLLGRSAQEGASAIKPNYEDELDNEDEYPDGEKEDLGSGRVDRLLVWGWRRRGPTRGVVEFGGLAHGTGNGASGKG